MELKRLQRSSLLAATALSVSVLIAPSAVAQPQPITLESRLASIAEEVSAKIEAAKRDTIAVLPMPHPDGTCTVLSVYVADELSQLLSTLPNKQLKITERMQLEQIMKEAQLPDDGLLYPQTTQQLGKISGIEALVVGSLTPVGDQVRVQLRIIATDTARTVASVAASIPKTPAVVELLGKAVTAGPLCSARQPAPTPPTAAAPTPPPQPPVSPDASKTVQGVRVNLDSIATPDRGTISINLIITNAGNKDVRILALESYGKSPVLTSSAHAPNSGRVVGFTVCSDGPRGCLGEVPPSRWTLLTKGEQLAISFTFNERVPPAGTKLNLSFNLMLLVENPGSATKFVALPYLLRAEMPSR